MKDLFGKWWFWIFIFPSILGTVAYCTILIISALKPQKTEKTGSITLGNVKIDYSKDDQFTRIAWKSPDTGGNSFVAKGQTDTVDISKDMYAVISYGAILVYDKASNNVLKAFAP